VRGAFVSNAIKHFFAVHGDVWGRQDAEFHLLAALREDFDPDVASDAKGFADAAGEDEHDGVVRVGLSSDRTPRAHLLGKCD